MILAVSRRFAARGLGISLPTLFLAASLTMTLAGCATDAPPPPPPPPPPPAPAGPPVALTPEVSDLASVYVDYIQQARNLSANFVDAASVQSELQTGASITPEQLAQGAVAYGAIVAMQEPSFRSSLRGYASNDAARADLLARIMADPSYATTLPGADAAARRVILALSSDGQSVYKAGTAVKQAAYDIQHQNWSKDFVADRPGRLALAKQNSVTLKSVQSNESAQLLVAALTGQGLVSRATTGQSTGDQQVQAAATSSDAVPAAAETAGTAAPLQAGQTTSVFDRPDLFNQPYTHTVAHALAIAAIAILGEGGTEHAPQMTALLDDGDSSKCFDMSKLNLYQCLAVAKPNYEDVFCLGQHVLMDEGQCLGKMSSNALSFEPKVNIGYNADGSNAYAHAEPYLKTLPAKKKTAPHKKSAVKKRK
ncbi:hypothetical protein [Asticcacaulis sp. EMRT-3]|uniref:hypothetical protein n=1 Tax=Asticcacaulis sp. EMRT-3 TaxID=3040349 RepID=UPI0024AFD919|nr:hypothetical protein [Asticcacaulis sp. EMRT-3]MDI7774877.1 hypothetical protein [Asticcacaulis sp. EMRT-3]